MNILQQKKWYNEKSRGFVTLISVLVVGVVAMTITVSMILLGLGSSRTGFAFMQSDQAKALANACAEEALQQIRDSTFYTGNGNLSLGQGTCTYSVTSQGGSNRTIAASGTVGTVIRKISITINAINPLITPVAWQEVS